MIGMLATWLVGKGLAGTMEQARGVARAGLLAAAVVAAALAFGLWLHFHDRGVIEDARLEGNNAALETKAEADAGAAAQRVEDTRRAAVEVRELQEAIEDAPDPIAARREFYRCIRVQQQARAAGQPAPAC